MLNNYKYVCVTCEKSDMSPLLFEQNLFVHGPQKKKRKEKQVSVNK